jgi:dystroglycan 1
LNLHLLTTNRRELSPSAWLQFDTKNQEFVGIPLEEEVGREEYQLVSTFV